MVNLQNSWFELWDNNNPIEIKSINNHETQFSTNLMLKDEVEKEINLKYNKKMIRVYTTNS
jgi:hypothetical protein